ncbi:MAG TPA: glycosyl hydrolase-related protein, partial [Gemmatimonadales bacterium]|nr:glycosyl hydrolase-related protein [Gemmatimonadales bacterium]
APVVARAGGLENGLLRLTLDPRQGVPLTDLRTGARYPDLLQVETEADLGDTYSFAPGPPATQAAPRWGHAAAAGGPLVGAMVLRARIPAGRAPNGTGPGAVDLRLTLSLQAGSPALRCSIALDNQGQDHRVRLRVARGAPGREVLAGGPFGPVRRRPVPPVGPADGGETPVPTAPAHRWVAAGAGRGVAVLAPGFFEYEHTPDGDLVVTLLRAIGQLSRADLPTRPGHAAWPTATPLAQSLGPDLLQLALLPLGRDFGGDAAALTEAWEDVFLPLRPVWLRQASRLSVPAGSLTLEGAGLVLSAVKPAAESRDLVLRCYNATSSTVEGRWHLPVPVSRASRVRADEREPEPLPLEDAGRTVRFRAGPRAMVTVALEL